MEKVLNFLRDGENKLPPGFRFQPTDEEIVFGYLVRKVFNYPLPSSIIPEINISSCDPFELPGDLDKDRYFFSNKQTKYPNINQTSRATCSGYWKPTGLDKYIIRSKKAPVIGIKKTLVFYRGSHRHEASKTNWIMHLYCIAFPGNKAHIIQHKKSSRCCLIQVGDWVLGHIFLKKKSTTKAEVADNVRLRAYDSTGEDVISDTDSSSDSSDSFSDSNSSALSEMSSSSVETSGENV